MNKIKILQFVGSMKNGGVESFVLSYFRELHELCEFTFVCFDDSTNIPREEIEKLGGKIEIVPHVKKLGQFNKAFDKILKENHYDIIHSNINTLSVFVLRIAKKNGYKIRIAHAHASSSRKEFVRHIIKSILKNFSRKYANVYFACGEEAGRYQFGNKAYNNNKVILINNCIDVDRFKFNQDDRKLIRDSLNLKDDDFVIGTVGRLVSVKNHNFILKLANINKDKKFVLVGSGELEQDLNAKIKEMKLENVMIVNALYPIEKYYSAFDTFVLPSLYEGFGIVAIEAEANGLYCLLSDQISRKVLISKYGEYLPIDKNGLEKWNEALQIKHKRIDCSKELKEQNFDIKESAKYLYKKYLELMEQFKD